MGRSDARQVKSKSHILNVNLVTVSNPIIKNLQTVIKNNLPILSSEMKNIFPEGSVNFTYKRGKILRELISPSMFPKAQVESHSMVSRCKSKSVTSAKTISPVRMNLSAQLLAKYIKREVSYVVLVLM